MNLYNNTHSNMIVLLSAKGLVVSNSGRVGSGMLILESFWSALSGIHRNFVLLFAILHKGIPSEKGF